MIECQWCGQENEGYVCNNKECPINKIHPGPCIVCGRTNYNLSFGGSAICPICDCGGCIDIGGHKYIRLDFIESYKHLIEKVNASSRTL